MTKPKLIKIRKVKTVKKISSVTKISVDKKKKVKTMKAPKITKADIKKHIILFSKNGVTMLEGLDISIVSRMIQEANTAYYNKKPLLSDGAYDILKEYLEVKDPEHPVLQEIGAPIEKQERRKVELPFHMGSMDKIKPDTGVLGKWSKKYKSPSMYFLSAKLDGISGLFISKGTEINGKMYENDCLYTRGNGKIGQDVSHLLKYVKIPSIPGNVIRGELIMKKSVFETKYSKTQSNSRNMVAGIVNRKTINPDHVKDVDFVAYESLIPRGSVSTQFKHITSMKIPTSQHTSIELKDLTNDTLSNYLVSWRDSYEYEIDGIIVSHDKEYPTNQSGNPDYAFAFKMVLSEQLVEAKVLDVLWSASKDGYLKPRIRIEPVTIGGAKIEYATAFNGQYVFENKIGVGAVIQLVRSGDVIPYITKIITPAPEGKMPTELKWKWNDSHVDIVLEDINESSEVIEKQLQQLVKVMEIDNLGPGTMKKVVGTGIKTPEQLLNITMDQLLSVDGVKEKTATKIHSSIQNQKETSILPVFMAASGMFGRGFSNKKAELITSSLHNIHSYLKSTPLNKEKKHKLVEEISGIQGFTKKTAQPIVDGLDDFIVFLKSIKQYTRLTTKSKDTVKKVLLQDHPLTGKSIVFTGFRSKDISAKLKELGAKEGSTVSKTTFAVVTKDPTKISSKIKKAQTLGITIYSPESFVSTFNL